MLLQPLFNYRIHFGLGESPLGAEVEQTFFLVWGQDSPGEGKIEILLKLRRCCLVILRGQFFIDDLAPFWIEKIEARFGQITRRFFEAGAQQLRKWIARLIFERQFFLPPPHQFAAMFFDQLVAGIGVWIKTEPLVKIWRPVVAPALPLSRIIWQRKRKGDVAFGHRLTDM